MIAFLGRGRTAAAVAIAFALLSPAALASKPRELVKMIGDVRVRVVLTEAMFGRLYAENRRIREDPRLCVICERMALTGDSLLWIPVGFKWEREGGLLLDPVIELIAKGRVYRSQEAWAGRPTRSGLITLRAPVKIPPGWECEPEDKDWKGVSVYVAFPRQLDLPGGGWPLTLHLDEVEDVSVRIY